MAFYLQSDKGTIIIGTLLTGYTGTPFYGGADDIATTAEQLKAMSPIHFSNNVTWTIIGSGDTYTISDGTNSVTTTNRNSGLYVYNSLKNPTFTGLMYAENAGIWDISVFYLDGSQGAPNNLIKKISDLSSEPDFPQPEVAEKHNYLHLFKYDANGNIQENAIPLELTTVTNPTFREKYVMPALGWSQDYWSRYPSGTPYFYDSATGRNSIYKYPGIVNKGTSYQDFIYRNYANGIRYGYNKAGNARFELDHSGGHYRLRLQYKNSFGNWQYFQISGAIVPTWAIPDENNISNRGLYYSNYYFAGQIPKGLTYNDVINGTSLSPELYYLFTIWVSPEGIPSGSMVGLDMLTDEGQSRKYLIPKAVYDYGFEYEEVTVQGDESPITGGGGGSGYFGFDDDKDVGLPPLPNVSLLDTGFCSVYSPSRQQIKNLAQYLWSDAFSVDSFKKLFANPIDTILSVHMLPVQPISDGSAEIKVGGISTGIISNTVNSNQYVTVSCGVVNVRERYGNFLDYEPYTHTEIFLPYIGLRSISTNDIMNKSISVIYRIDIVTGACVAFIKIDNKLKYQFTGNCASPIPISSADYKNTLSSLVNLTSAVAGVVAGVAVGGVAGAVATAPNLANKTLDTAFNMRPNISAHGSSNASSVAGMLSSQTPYLIMSYPKGAYPENYKNYNGLPAHIKTKLGDIAGYTEVEEIHLPEIPQAEQAEIEEIETLLKGGVYINVS